MFTSFRFGDGDTLPSPPFFLIIHAHYKKGKNNVARVKSPCNSISSEINTLNSLSRHSSTSIHIVLLHLNDYSACLYMNVPQFNISAIDRHLGFAIKSKNSSISNNSPILIHVNCTLEPVLSCEFVELLIHCKEVIPIYWLINEVYLICKSSWHTPFNKDIFGHAANRSFTIWVFHFM